MTNPIEIAVGADATGPLLELDAAGRLAGDVANAIASATGEVSDGPIPTWIDHPDRAQGDLAAALAEIGLTFQRDLWKLEVDLPPKGGFEAAASVEVRPFEVGADEAAWVEVNNRAFAWHREQGGWTVEQVAQRESEDWFDPAGFLIHEVGGKIAGFCWTKIHEDEDPAAGEIYVIGVDPDHHGKGLGRAMTVAGLESIYNRGYRRGILYVDADNIPAAKLYESLGFTIDTTRRLFVPKPTSASN